MSVKASELKELRDAIGRTGRNLGRELGAEKFAELISSLKRAREIIDSVEIYLAPRTEDGEPIVIGTAYYEFKRRWP